jgi:hypothetical protein
MTLEPRLLRTFEIGDRVYELYARVCTECGEDFYSVMRTSGMNVSIFHFGHRDMDGFEEFCKDVDEDLLFAAPQLVAEFLKDLQKINSKNGIEANFSFVFRLLEFGRIRMLRLKALGVEKALQDTAEKLPKESAKMQAAFELGFAAGQYAANKHSEDFFWEGVRTIEAREAGQERARLALSRKGKKTRAAVAHAAEEIRRSRPEIGHNIAAVAREILKLGKPELCRSDGRPISEETVCKYLREARKCKNRENCQENTDSGKTSR